MKKNQWDIIVEAKSGWFDIDLTEVWKYRGLVTLFVKRDFVTFYKQTILGPLWYIIQPLFTTMVFTVIFGKIAKIPTDNLPPFLFYLSGNILWSFFSSCLLKTSNTFVSNAGIFGKVYFPRLTAPLAAITIGALQFFVQFALFLGFYFFFLYRGTAISGSYWILALPVILLQMALLAMGVGIFVSSLTAKYKDLQFAMGFAVQLWMYATPIVYPLTSVPEKYRLLYAFNPMVAIVEGFRYAFLGVGAIQPVYFLIGWVVTLCMLFVGVLLFSRTEKSFMDTV